MTITTIAAKPTAHSLGGAHFFSPTGPEASRLFRSDADADPCNPLPIGLAICGAGCRTAVDLSIEEAEALGNILADAISRRKAAEANIAAARHRQARVFFADPDGPLEAA
ncbi:MAG TPA: hypothetical protein PKD38_16195 [Nitrospira sp.]|nr:hypothetical protein [Nitrospira sp.]